MAVREKEQEEDVGLTGERLSLVHRYMTETDVALAQATRKPQRWTPRPQRDEEETLVEEEPAVLRAVGLDPVGEEPGVVHTPAADPAEAPSASAAAEVEAAASAPAEVEAASARELPIHVWVNAGAPPSESDPDWPKELLRLGMERSRRAREAGSRESYF